MSRKTLSYTVGVILAVAFLALAVYYYLPHVPHPFTSAAYPAYGHHYSHVLLFTALAIISLVGARFIANSGASPAAPSAPSAPVSQRSQQYQQPAGQRDPRGYDQPSRGYNQGAPMEYDRAPRGYNQPRGYDPEPQGGYDQRGGYDRQGYGQPASRSGGGQRGYNQRGGYDQQGYDR